MFRLCSVIYLESNSTIKQTKEILHLLWLVNHIQWSGGYPPTSHTVQCVASLKHKKYIWQKFQGHRAGWVSSPPYCRALLGLCRRQWVIQQWHFCGVEFPLFGFLIVEENMAVTTLRCVYVFFLITILLSLPTLPVQAGRKSLHKQVGVYT